ncbi:MAG: DUF99 family protein [Thermoplasmata archaeon]
MAVDDGRFDRRDRWATIAAVVVSLPSDVESVRLGRVTVDGRDATARIAEAILRTGHAADIRAVLLDGVVVGGFNPVDLGALHRRIGWPVIAVTAERPDRAGIRRALRRWFPRDARARERCLFRHRLFRVVVPGRPIFAAVVGARRIEAAALIARTIRRGRWPEPLRLAHLIASAPKLSAPSRRPRATRRRTRTIMTPPPPRRRGPVA